MKAPRPQPPVPEVSPLRHSFAAGSHYENMKGTYEVLSIEGNTMRIRWESGEESETEVELQDRILSRFEREVRARKAGAGSRPDDEGEPQLVPQSRGVVPADFSPDVSQTTWRARTGGLGGLVAHELNVPELCFGFWVPFRQPMILWADVSQRTTSAAQVQAGFVCRLDEAQARFGFFVRRSGEADGRGNWHRFVEWLRAPEHEEWLRLQAEANGLEIVDGRNSPCAGGTLRVEGTKWVWAVADGRTEVAGLAEFFETEPAEPGSLLECVTSIERDRAVGRGRKIGRDIAQLFEALMPLYRACLGLPKEPNSSSPPRKRRRAD